MVGRPLEIGTAVKRVSTNCFGIINIESMSLSQTQPQNNLKGFANLLGNDDMFDRAFEQSAQQESIGPQSPPNNLSLPT